MVSTDTPAFAVPDDLAPESRAIVTRMADLGLLDQEVTTVEELRRLTLQEAPLLGTGPPLDRIEDDLIETSEGPLPVRIYHPPSPPARAILWLHGGGWVVGDLDFADAGCRALCLDTGSLVVSVGYRLAPEHPFPAGLEDAYAAVRWTADHLARGPESPLVVAGDSAGGNLAAALCLVARERGVPRIDHQLLLYPATDRDFGTISYRQFAEGYVLTREMMRWCWDLYTGGPDTARHMHASVLLAPSMRGLPPATIVIAGSDVLRDDGLAYAARLHAEEVPVDVLRYPGQLHGFWSCLGVTDVGRSVNAQIRASLERRDRS